jgi:hypothetical protein
MNGSVRSAVFHEPDIGKDPSCPTLKLVIWRIMYLKHGETVKEISSRIQVKF